VNVVQRALHVVLVARELSDFGNHVVERLRHILAIILAGCAQEMLSVDSIALQVNGTVVINKRCTI